MPGSWQGHPCQPEIVDVFHHRFECVELDRFGQETIRVERIALLYVHVRARCRQYDGRNDSEGWVRLDPCQNLPAKGGLVLGLAAESKRLLDQNPNAGMSLEDIQGEIARRAVQWGAPVVFGEPPVILYG